MMKIVLAGPAWPYRGGIAEFSNRLARQFRDEGHQTEIITFRLQYPAFLFPGKTQITDSPPPEKIHIRRLINSVNPVNWLFTGLKIRRERPDLLILRFWLPVMGPSLATIARIVRGNNHTKTICIFDNVVPHEKRPGDRVFTKYFASSIDGAVVMADAVGRDLRKFRTDMPVRLNPHPLYDNYGQVVGQRYARQALGLDQNKKYILFFGFVRKYKGLDLLLRAFADKHFRNSGFGLIVAGEFYDDEELYRQVVTENELEKDVIFFNRFIKDEEVALFFSAADIVAQPYRTATQSGVSQIAFHFGIPVLVTDVGGLREIVPDRKCGYVVNPDPGEIASALLDYFQNNRKEAFTDCVKEHRKNFLWDKMTATILDCYSEIVSLKSG